MIFTPNHSRCPKVEDSARVKPACIRVSAVRRGAPSKKTLRRQKINISGHEQVIWDAEVVRSLIRVAITFSATAVHCRSEQASLPRRQGRRVLRVRDEKGK